MVRQIMAGPWPCHKGSRSPDRMHPSSGLRSERKSPYNPAVAFDFVGTSPDEVEMRGTVHLMTHRGYAYWFFTWGPADDTENLATEDVEIETVVDRVGTEPGDKAAHTDDRLARIIRHVQICKAEKKIEKPASVTITRNIASTTDKVVSRPTLSALPVT